jgi:hypothetical protein
VAAPASPLQEVVALASSLQEEACAAARARSAEAFALAERVGSGSAQADWVQDERFPGDCSAAPASADSAALTVDDHSVPVAGLDGSPPADCSADSVGYSLVLSADGSPPGDCLAPVDSAVPQADASSPVDCSAATVSADSAALRADDSAVRGWPRQGADSGPGDWPGGSPVGW